MSVYDRVPVNRSAALVTSQSGCSDGELTDEQRRENLVARSKKLHSLICALPKGPERKRLNKEKSELDKQINAIRPKKTAPGVEKYVMDILREDLSDFQFNRLLDRAYQRLRQDSLKRRGD